VNQRSIVLVVAVLILICVAGLSTYLSGRSSAGVPPESVAVPVPATGHAKRQPQTSMSGLASSTKIYTNAQYAFRISYKSSDNQCSGNTWADILSPNHGSLFFCEEIDGSYNLGRLTIGASSNLLDIEGCLVSPSSADADVTDLGTTTIDSIPFHSFSIGSPGAAQFTIDYVYMALREQTCFAIIENITGPNPRHDNSSQDAMENVDRHEVQKGLELLLQSIRFLR
jgi:hypothetical protein